MISTAMIVFAVSLVGIVALFFVRRIEENRDARFAAALRARADTGALHMKAMLERVEVHIENIPWFIAALARYGVHVGALSFARVARTSAEQAHRLADFVSHKRNFERRETKSEFLKQVSGRKNEKGLSSGKEEGGQI